MKRRLRNVALILGPTIILGIPYKMFIVSAKWYEEIFYWFPYELQIAGLWFPSWTTLGWYAFFIFLVTFFDEELGRLLK